MEPTYQQITDILVKRIDEKVNGIIDLEKPVRSESDTDLQHNILVEKYYTNISVLNEKLIELKETLNEITALKESLNTETPTKI